VFSVSSAFPKSTESDLQYMSTVPYFDRSVPSGILYFWLPMFALNLPNLTKSDTCLSVDRYTYRSGPFVDLK
jgi:hypothetical protein